MESCILRDGGFDTDPNVKPLSLKIFNPLTNVGVDELDIKKLEPGMAVLFTINESAAIAVP
jgi:hypothetical protein